MQPVSSSDLEILFKGILDSQRRANSIMLLSTMVHERPSLGKSLFIRPAVLPGMILEIMKNYPWNSRINETTTELIIAIACLFQQIVLDDDVRDEFIKTGIPLYLLPYLNRDIKCHQKEQMKVNILNLFVTATNKISVEAMELFLMGYKEEEIGLIPIDYHVNLKKSLFDFAVASIVETTSVVGKTMALMLTARLLASATQLKHIAANKEAFTQLVSALNYVVFYMDENMSNIRDPRCATTAGVTTKISLNKGKRLLQFTLKCWHMLASESTIQPKLGECLPKELHSRKFTKFFNGDLEVDAWLDNIWSQIME